MKRQDIQDERIIIQRRKANSEALGIVMLALLASVLVQQFYLGADAGQYAAELICFISASAYMIIRHMTLGLSLYGEGKRAVRILVATGVITGVVATIANGVLNYKRYAAHYEDNTGLFIAGTAVFFISVTALIFAVLLPFHLWNKRNQAKIQQKLDAEEQDG